jgi:dimethylglycine dehydrogenase
MNGEPEIDLWPVDSRRYGSYANWAYNHEKIEDTYPRLYAIICPNDWRDVARPTAPPHLCLPEAGGRRLRRLLWMGVPQLFYRQPCGQSRKPGLEAQQYGFKYVEAECKHVMENAGLLDLSRFAKTRISGPGAEAWLNHMTCQKVPTADGRIALSPMLDHNGNFKSDMTVTRIKDGEYFCVTASVGKRHDQHWMMENLPTDGSVVHGGRDLQGLGCLVIAGPEEPRCAGRSLLQRCLQPGICLRHQQGDLCGTDQMPGQPHDLCRRTGV